MFQGDEGVLLPDEFVFSVQFLARREKPIDLRRETEFLGRKLTWIARRLLLWRCLIVANSRCVNHPAFPVLCMTFGKITRRTPSLNSALMAYFLTDSGSLMWRTS